MSVLVACRCKCADISTFPVKMTISYNTGTILQRNSKDFLIKFSSIFKVNCIVSCRNQYLKGSKSVKPEKSDIINKSHDST